MRTLGQIPHPEVLISLFSWNGKFIVKFEQGLCEQSYKFDHLDFEGENDFRAKITPEFVASVLASFPRMQETHARFTAES